MTREEVARALRAMPEAATEPTLQVIADLIERRDSDPVPVLLEGLGNLARRLAIDPAKLAAFQRTTQALERDAWRAVAHDIAANGEPPGEPHQVEALFVEERMRRFVEGIEPAAEPIDTDFGPRTVDIIDTDFGSKGGT